MSGRGRVTRLGLRNFKAFRYLPDIELRPLTILCGANSTGKTSILQSLLLLKQTSTPGRLDDALRFSGDDVDLGDFSKTISDFDTSNTLEYRFGVLLSDPDLDGELNGDFKISFRSTPSGGTTIEQCSLTCRVPGETETLSSLTYDQNAGWKYEGLFFRNHEVLDLNVLDPIRLQSLDRGAVQIEYEGPDEQEVLPVLKAAVAFIGQLSPVGEVVTAVANMLDGIQHLGPVRADPQPFYPVTSTADIGHRGEGTIPFLLRHQDDKVSYHLSATDQSRKGTLLEALNAWLGTLQITDCLTIAPVQNVALTAAISAPTVKSRAVDLVHVGFGISQILPVLTMALKARSDAFLLYEQPEIHLHPRLQAGLADFFLASARDGKTIVVETHSDHLVNRIRRRIAEDETGELAKLVQILFVHAGTETDPGSYVEPLEIDAYGTVLNAPTDFFPEAADEAFALMAARRRRSGRGKT